MQRALIQRLEPRTHLDAAPAFQASAAVPVVTAAGAANTPIVVRYLEPTVLTSTFGDGNLVVTGPSGFSTGAKYVGLDPTDPGPGHGLRIADYAIVTPAGGWQAANNGNYRVTAIANQVKDAQFGFLPPSDLDAFNVAIPAATSQLSVTIDGQPVADGGVVDFGTVPGVSKTVTITNNGADQPWVAALVTSAGPEQLLSISGLSSQANLAPGASLSFTVTLIGQPADGASAGSIVLTPNFAFHVNAAPALAPTTPTVLPTFSTPIRGMQPTGGSMPSVFWASPTMDAPTADAPTAALTVAYVGQQPDVSTFSSGNLLIACPRGFLTLARYAGLDPLDQPGGAARRADYIFDAPGGSWTPDDDGTYYVIANPAQVRDPVLGFLPSGAIASFNVQLPTASPLQVTVDGVPMIDGQTVNFGTDAVGISGRTHAIVITNVSDQPQVVLPTSQQNAPLNPAFGTGGNQPTFFVNASGATPFYSSPVAAALPPGASIAYPLTFDPQQATPVGPVYVPFSVTAASAIGAANNYDPGEAPFTFVAFGNVTPSVDDAAPLLVTVEGQQLSESQSIAFTEAGQTRAVTVTNTSPNTLVVQLAVQPMGTEVPPGSVGDSPFTTDAGAAVALDPGASHTFHITLASGVLGAASAVITLTALRTGANTSAYAFAPMTFVTSALVAPPTPTSTLTQPAPGKPITFTDAAGLPVTLKLTGPGTLSVAFNAAQPNNADPAMIVLTGTTARSALKVVTRGAITIGGLTDSGPLGTLAAPTATLTGTFGVDGGVKTITAANIGPGWNASISGMLGTLKVRGDAGGNLAATAIGTINAASLTHARYLAGASFGADGQPGGGDDIGGPGAIGSIIVGGDVTTGSLVAAGLLPANGVFFDGDDQPPMGNFSTIKSIIVRGAVADDSHFAAGKFAKVKIGGKKVDVATDPRLTLDA